MKILIGILHCIFCLITHAQPPGGIFYHLTAKNGLSSDRVNAVIQDREGFYWIATQDGLNRFDGSNCKVFRNINDDSTSLSQNDCKFLLEDDKGDIWVTTPWVIHRYIKKTGKFERFYLSHPSLSTDQLIVRGIVKDEAGNIWFASAGLWQYNIYSRQWKRYLHEPDNLASIPGGFIFYLQYDKFSKGLWMTAWVKNARATFFDIAKGEFYHQANNPQKIPLFVMDISDGALALDSAGILWFYNYPDYQLCSYSSRSKTLRFLPHKIIPGGFHSVYVDKENRIWFNPWVRHTQIYDPAKNKIDTSFLVYYHQQSALSSFATHLYVDRTGNYFIGSAKGVSIYNPRAQAVRYFWLPDKRQAEPGAENIITSLVEQNDSVLWTGTGGGLFRYDLAQNKTRHIKNLPLSKPYIRCLYLHSDFVLWIGGWNELLLFDILSEKVIKKISLAVNPQFITAGNPGQIWVGTWAQGLLKLSTGGNLTDTIVKQPDNKGMLLYNGLTCFTRSTKEPDLWIGYNRGYGFFKLNYTNQAIENFKIPVTSPFRNVSNSIKAIAEDSRGNLWLGSYGGGLVYFDRSRNSFTRYTQSDGLKGDYINKILLDTDSNIWVTTSNGLSIIDGRTHSIINSEIDLSFPDNDFRANGIVRRNKKLLFFSGLKIVEIDPAAYLQSGFPSRIMISSFKIFEKETPLTAGKTGSQKIHLKHNQNFFSFDYSLLKTDPESPTRYAYQLLGFDNDWNYVRERRTAFYTNVPPGNYEFLIKATGESGNWNYFSEPVVIVISPPFWKTWWFYVACGLLIAGATVYFIRNRLKQFKKRQTEQLRLVVATQEQEKKNIAAELHDDLGVRLSALKYFVSSLKEHLQPDNPRSEETYKKTMKVIDESVEDIRYMLVNLSPKTLNEYGYLMAVEDLVNKLKNLHIIEIELKQKGMEERLPADMEAGLYRITQELINNTLKHAGATTIHLSIENSGGYIRLQYADNGKGFHPAATGQGYGMQNIHTRVALLNGKIEWDAVPGKPTSVTIIIPYNHT
jgi:signal transduction histidine kinase/ligand-binding sensor domain-containing protein